MDVEEKRAKQQDSLLALKNAIAAKDINMLIRLRYEWEMEIGLLNFSLAVDQRRYDADVHVELVKGNISGANKEARDIQVANAGMVARSLMAETQYSLAEAQAMFNAINTAIRYVLVLAGEKSFG